MASNDPGARYNNKGVRRQEYEKYIKYMEPEYRDDNFDILVLHHTEDVEDARKFKSRVEKDCRLTSGGRRKLVVKLQDEYRGDGDVTTHLDQAHEKAHFILLLVTKNFCGDASCRLRATSSLSRAMEKRRWCVAPVYTEDSKTMQRKNYRLPMLLAELHGINIWAGCYFIEAIVKLVESQYSLWLDMDLKLEKDRQEYYESHKDKLQDLRQCERRQRRRRELKQHKSPESANEDTVKSSNIKLGVQEQGSFVKSQEEKKVCSMPSLDIQVSLRGEALEKDGSCFSAQYNKVNDSYVDEFQEDGLNSWPSLQGTNSSSCFPPYPDGPPCSTSSTEVQAPLSGRSDSPKTTESTNLSQGGHSADPAGTSREGPITTHNHQHTHIYHVINIENVTTMTVNAPSGSSGATATIPGVTTKNDEKASHDEESHETRPKENFDSEDVTEAKTTLDSSEGASYERTDYSVNDPSSWGTLSFKNNHSTLPSSTEMDCSPDGKDPARSPDETWLKSPVDCDSETVTNIKTPGCIDPDPSGDLKALGANLKTARDSSQETPSACDLQALDSMEPQGDFDIKSPYNMGMQVKSGLETPGNMKSQDNPDLTASDSSQETPGHCDQQTLDSMKSQGNFDIEGPYNMETQGKSGLETPDNMKSQGMETQGKPGLEAPDNMKSQGMETQGKPGLETPGNMKSQDNPDLEMASKLETSHRTEPKSVVNPNIPGGSDLKFAADWETLGESDLEMEACAKLHVGHEAKTADPCLGLPDLIDSASFGSTVTSSPH